jgi:hypothetical protein
VPRLPTVGFTIVRNVCSFALARACIGPPQAVTHFPAAGATPEAPGVVDSAELPPEHDAVNARTIEKNTTERARDGFNISGVCTA